VTEIWKWNWNFAKRKHKRNFFGGNGNKNGIVLSGGMVAKTKFPFPDNMKFSF
jgi:hypothetical protein